MINKNDESKKIRLYVKLIIGLLIIGGMISLIVTFFIFKTASKKASEKWHEKKIIGGDMDYQLYWSMSLISSGLGDIGEYLDTASRIKEDDYESWHKEWYKTAERMRAHADKSLEGGHNVSAGEAYLRAAAYYRLADFYYAIDPDNPGYLESAKKCERYFIKGMKLISAPMEVVEIPYQNTTLRGYFFRSSDAEEDVPVIIVEPGFDAWAEEMVFVALAANKRGYHCLLFNGPGQGMIVREKNLKFKPDWETVITPVVDYVITISGVNPEKIALMASSMGGALATRAVAYEHRINSCILSPGYYDLYDAFLGALPEKLVKLITKYPEVFDKLMISYLKKSWELSHAIYVFGVDKPSELATGSKLYRYQDDIKKIRCNVLIMDGTAEEILGKGQPKKLFEKLECPKTYMQFTSEDVAELHCQVGALNFANERMFDWLDDNLKK